MKETVAIIIALGAIAALALWVLKRWFSYPSEIIRLKEQVDGITRTIVIIEKKPPTYSNRNRLNGLYRKRMQVNERIKRLRRN